MLRCSHRWLVSLQFVSSVIHFFFSCIFSILPCHHSPFCLLVPLLSIYHCSTFRVFPPSSLISAGSLRCNPGGVSSGQSYSTSQYESGLQQRSQQGEQQGHQPRALLHTAGWVAVADGTPRRAYQNRSTLLFLMKSLLHSQSNRLKVFKIRGNPACFSLHFKFFD